MPDSDLVSRLRAAADEPNQPEPTLLIEAAAALEAVPSLEAAHRKEIKRSDARFATITLRGILGGASEAEIIENARAAVRASEMPDHRGPLTDAELEAIGEPDPTERERLQAALDAAGTMGSAARSLGLSLRAMKLLMIQHRPEWPRKRVSIGEPHTVQPLASSDPAAVVLAFQRRAAPIEQRLGPPPRPWAAQYMGTPDRPVDKDPPRGEVKRFAWMEVGGFRFENVEIEQGPLCHGHPFDPAEFGADPEHATQEQAERLLGLDVPDSTMMPKGARLEVVGGDPETIRALRLQPTGAQRVTVQARDDEPGGWKVYVDGKNIGHSVSAVTEPAAVRAARDLAVVKAILADQCAGGSREPKEGK